MLGTTRISKVFIESNSDLIITKNIKNSLEISLDMISVESSTVSYLLFRYKIHN